MVIGSNILCLNVIGRDLFLFHFENDDVTRNNWSTKSVRIHENRRCHDGSLNGFVNIIWDVVFNVKDYNFNNDVF